MGFGGGHLATTADTERNPRALDPTDFKNRFFSAGPTYIFGILSSIDDRISGYNSSTSTSACLSQDPVQYTVTPFGQTVTMYAQCYQQIGGGFTGDPGLIQWGVKDSIFYLYSAIGAGWTAAIATPIGVTGQYSIQAWSSVGVGNGAVGTTGACSTSWDSCSYGVIQISANPVTSNFEMSVAGMGFGYCGAQYNSDGVNIYGTGSTDMGATCNTTDTICVLASDASTAATCTGPEQSFSLPALGRLAESGVAQANWGASGYPGGGGNTITLNGTSGDDVHFGPIVPTVGVGQY